jgi:integrase
LFAVTPTGSDPWRPDTATHWFEKLRKTAGVNTTLKNLRHFHATQLISGGVDVVTVANRLGHASSATTLNFYAKFDDRADVAAAEKMSLILPRNIVCDETPEV